MSKISIILPVYNVEKYIRRSIESILAQTYKDFELLIIIDGSPDNSLAIALEYAEKDSRITVYEKPNGGLSDARNHGLQRAKGQYIYFMDSDDWIEPNLLAVGIDAINIYKSDLVIFGYHLDHESLSGQLLSTKEIKEQEVVFSKEKNNLKFGNHTLGLLGYAWNKLYNASFIKSHKLVFDKGISLVEDMLFNARVYEKTDKIVFVDKPLYHYIDRPSASLIKTFHKSSFELKIMRTSALQKFLASWNVDFKMQNVILAKDIVNAIRYCSNNLFSYDKDAKYKFKKDYLTFMLSHPMTVKYSQYFVATTLKEKIFKNIIINQAVLSLYTLCKITKQ